MQPVHRPAIPITSQRQKLEEHKPPFDIASSSDDRDILKLEVEFSHAELHSPRPSDSGHFDDDDDCIDFLASLDISNEANVMWRTVAFGSECS